jgi:protein-S-isoprenylcysteine O-methyltransferase Ste14
MLIAYGQFLFRYRNYVFPLVLFTLFISFTPHFFLGDRKLDIWMNAGGILVILCGQALRASVIGLAYIKRGGRKKRIYADTLVTDGLFAHCRNPLYLGNLLIITGFLLIYNNFHVYLLGGTFFLISYMAIVAAEESFLGQKFGNDFDRYCSRVNRWLFDLTGIRNTLLSMKFSWQRVLYKDYTTFLTWVLTVLLIISLEQIRHYGFTGSLVFITWASALAFPVMIMTIGVRMYKKNGRLVQ